MATDFEKMLLTESFPVVSVSDERRDKLSQSRIPEESGPTDTDTQLEKSVPSFDATTYKQVLV